MFLISQYTSPEIHDSVWYPYNADQISEICMSTMIVNNLERYKNSLTIDTIPDTGVFFFSGIMDVLVFSLVFIFFSVEVCTSPDLFVTLRFDPARSSSFSVSFFSSEFPRLGREDLVFSRLSSSIKSLQFSSIVLATRVKSVEVQEHCLAMDSFSIFA